MNTIKNWVRGLIGWKVVTAAVVFSLIGLSALNHFYVEPLIAKAAGVVQTVEDAFSSEVVAHADTVKYITEEREFPKALQAICTAESGGKQFKADGRVVRGHVNPSDIGICQINEPIWNDLARELGFDIYTEAGNKDMALWLFDRYGTEPWNASKHMWIKKIGQ